MQRGITEIYNVKGHVAALLHDLIPITHPWYCSENYTCNFTHYLPFLVANTDLFIPNSQTTDNELKQYLHKNSPSRKPAISHFYLGTDLDLIKQTLPVRKNFQTMIATNKPYLCVGTIEPRKNHALLLDAFDRIWEKNHEIYLCIIGCYGWKSEKLIERIINHPLFGDNLTWFNDINDSELAYCYNNAKSLIFPSIIEGFGLPLVEALHYDCPVMASDIPVFREIGTDKCAYFSPDNPDDLVSLIEEFEIYGKLPGVEEKTEFKWPNWEESALEFYTIIAEHFAEK